MNKYLIEIKNIPKLINSLENYIETDEFKLLPSKDKKLIYSEIRFLKKTTSKFSNKQTIE